MVSIKDVLAELCALSGPSGFEEPVTERVKDLLAPFVDDTWIDVLGNVVGVVRSGKESAKKLLFDAHIDEIGMIITGVEEGFLRFAALGALDPRSLPASDVKVCTDPPLYGVISVLPPHVIKAEDADKAIKIEDMFIDIGMSKEEAEKLAPIGTMGVLANATRSIGEGGICGKALDDRAGFAAILRALDLMNGERPDVDLYVMASVQEEVGLRGAGPGAFDIGPDICVVVDVDFAKTPDTKPADSNEVLGGGAGVSMGPNMNRKFTEQIIELARKNGIAHQINVEPGGNSGTNAAAIQISRSGVATALLGIPMRYMHGANEYILIEDVESTAKLLYQIVKAAES